MVPELAAALHDRLPAAPDAFIVLGSGLAPLANELEEVDRIAFGELPGHPDVRVAGHSGAYVFGRMSGRWLLLQSGRIHLYEGHSPHAAAVPIRIAAELGARSALLTNAAGGIHPRLPPGSLVLIDDHLNLTFRSPLVGPIRPGDERFPDMGRPYDPDLARLFLDAAAKVQVPLQRGVYGGVLGPTYETPSEIRMLSRMGADVVGMSTVPEVIAARACEIPVAGISVVTNWASGISARPLSHGEVLKAGERASGTVLALVRAVVPRLP